MLHKLIETCKVNMNCHNIYWFHFPILFLKTVILNLFCIQFKNLFTELLSVQITRNNIFEKYYYDFSRLKEEYIISP